MCCMYGEGTKPGGTGVIPAIICWWGGFAKKWSATADTTKEHKLLGRGRNKESMHRQRIHAQLPVARHPRRRMAAVEGEGRAVPCEAKIEEAGEAGAGTLASIACRCTATSRLHGAKMNISNTSSTNRNRCLPTADASATLLYLNGLKSSFTLTGGFFLIIWVPKKGFGCRGAAADYVIHQLMHISVNVKRTAHVPRPRLSPWATR